MAAEVIPDEQNQRLAVAECPDDGWRGKRHRWSADAHLDADRHNARRHAEEADRG